jgi:hypothetical protein
MAKRSIGNPVIRRDLVPWAQRMEAVIAPPIAPRGAKGDWHVDPDRIAWTDPTTDYPCVIRLERSGQLAGYVGIPSDHWLWGYQQDAIPPDVVADVAELGYAAPSDQHGPALRSARRVAGKACVGQLWWFGTACNRICDVIPNDAKHGRDGLRLGVKQTYLDVHSLHAVCTALAAALKAASLEDVR